MSKFADGYKKWQEQRKQSFQEGYKKWRIETLGATEVAQSIQNKVQSWANEHNSFLQEYTDRFGNRNGDYSSIAYVGDADAWSENATNRGSTLGATADQLISEINNYRELFNDEYVNEVIQALNSSRDTYSSIADIAKSDVAFWAQFNPTEEQKAAGYDTAEKLYGQWRLNQKYLPNYEGMTYDEASLALDNLFAHEDENKEEIEWVKGYLPTLWGAGEAKAVSSRADRKVADAENLLNEYNRLKKIGGAEYEAISREIGSKYSGVWELEREVGRLKNEAALKSNEAKYGFLQSNEDFNQYSAYDPTIATVDYAYLNMSNEERIAYRRELIYADIEEGNETGNSAMAKHFEKLDQLSADEIAVYNYIFKKDGEKEAAAYLEWMSDTMQGRVDERVAQIAADYANAHPFAASAFSVATSLGSGFEYVKDAAGYLADKALGNPNAKIEKNTSSLVTNAIRSKVSEKTNWNIKGWDAFDFLYNTAMSGVDSFTAGIGFGNGGAVILGLSAAAQGTQDALDRGMSNEQAFWNGLFNGVFEGLFEKMSIGNFKALKEVSPKSIKDVCKNIAKSMLVNASEESLTEIANITYDTLVNGEFANYTIEDIMKNGALKQALGQVFEAGVSGALMGAGFGSVGSASGYAAKKSNDFKTGSSIMSADGGVDALKNLANEVAGASSADVQAELNELSGKVSAEAATGKGLGKITAAAKNAINATNVGNLYGAVQKANNTLNKADVAKSLERNGFNSSDASTIAGALVDKYNGEVLTKKQEKLLKAVEKNQKVQAAVSNIIKNEKSTIGRRSQDIRNFNNEVESGIIINRIKKAYEAAGGTKEKATYKSLDDRIADDSGFSVSDSGEAMIRGTDEKINLNNAAVVKTGDELTFKLKDGNEVLAKDIDFADDDQSYMVYAVSKIENLTPEAATAIIQDIVDTSKPISAQLNGVDEAYTYGYYGYPEADLKAGAFTSDLTNKQMRHAYRLGQAARIYKGESKAETFKNMRTAAQAEAEKAKAEGKEAPKPKNLTVSFDKGNGEVVSFDEAFPEGTLDEKRRGAAEVAKILHQMGLGTRVEFFESFESETMKVKDRKTGELVAARVFINAKGEEQLAPSGVYRKDNGTIRVDLNAYNGKGLTLNALAHELTHFIQQWSDTKYNVLADFLVKAYEKTDMTMNERVIREQKRLEEIRGEKVSYDEAFDEVVANAMMKMFDDGTLVQKLTELKAQDEGLARKLWEGFKKILAKFLGIYEEAGPLFKDTADLMTMKETFEQLQNMFAEAMVEASENYQASQPEASHKGEQYSSQETDLDRQRYNAFREKFAKERLDLLSDKLGNLFPLSAGFEQAIQNDKTKVSNMIVLANSQKRANGESFYTAGKNAFKKVYGSKTTFLIKQLGINADADESFARESMSKVSDTKDLQTILDLTPEFKQLIEESRLLSVERTRHNDNKKTSLLCYRLYNAYIRKEVYTDKSGKQQTSEVPHIVVFNVVQNLNDAKAHMVTDIKDVAVSNGHNSSKLKYATHANGNISIANIADVYGVVKSIDRKKGGLRYSAENEMVYKFDYSQKDSGELYSSQETDLDSKGSQLSKEQQAFFKNSKARDENGNLKVMYHGSPESFTEFDRKKAKSSGYYGSGFYFTDSESHAGQYGNKHEVYLNITNPLQDGTNDITKEQLRKFVEAIADNEDYGIDNYGYGATVDSVTDSVYGKSDFAMLMDINASCVGNMVEAIELFNEVNGTDYNGIIAPTETVAFYPNQIKSVTNDKPTGDPDMRYSSQETDADNAHPYAYDTLISKPDMAVTTVDSNVPENRADVVYQAKQNAAKVGKFDPKTGSVSVYVDDIGADVILGTDGLKHGLHRTKDAQNDANYIVTLKAGEIIKNSIKINETNPKKLNATGSYVLIGAAKNTSGDLYIVRSVVNQFKNELAAMDVLYAINAKKELAATKSPRSMAKPLSETSSTISIAKLLDLVNQYFPDVLPEDVLKHYGYDARPEGDIGDGMLYSEHDTDYSNRSLLANAFESITNGSEEYKLIQKYKGYIAELNSLENKLSEFNREIRKIRFTEGEYDAEKLRKLESEAKKIAEAINKYDQYLLSLEASKPLRNIIEQERRKEAQKTRGHVKEIQENKKLRAEHTELRHKIRKAVRDLNKILNRGNKKQNVKEDMKGFVSKALELADYLFTDHVSNDDLIRKGITVRMTAKEAALVKETEDILTQLYDNADSLTDEEFTRLDAKRKANEEKLRDLLTAQRNERLNTPVYNLFNDLVTEYANLKNSKQESVKAAFDPNVERFLRSYIGESDGETDSDRKTLLQNMRVADMTTDELWKLYNAYTMVLHTVRNANNLFVKGKTESIEQMAGRIMGDFANRKVPDKKMAIVARNLSNKIGWDYEKLYYALDRIGSEAFTELVINIANSENTVMQDVIEAAIFRDEMVEKYGYNNWDVNKKIDKEFLDNTGKKFKLTLGELMALYAYSRREGAWDHIEYGGFAFGKNELTNPKPADTYKLSKAQCEAITNTLTKEQKSYAEDMQKYLSVVMGEKGNEVSMLMYGIKMFGEKNYFPLHIYGVFKAQAQESQAKAAEGFTSMSNAGFTHAQNPNAKAPFVLEGFNEVWADHVNEMSRYHGTVPALEDMRRVMNRSFYSESGMESMAIKQLMENSYGKEAVEYFNNLYREANSGAITDKLQKKSKKLLSLFRKNSVAYSLSVLVQQPASIVRAYDLIDKKYFGFKGFGAITGGVAKAVSNKWTKAHTNAYNEMLKYAPGVTMAKEIGGFDTATGGSIRSYLLDTNKKFKQKWKTGTAVEKGKAVLDLVDNNAIANLPNVADKIAWIEIWNACKRETVAKHKDLATSSEEFMQIVGDRFTEVIRATQVYDSIFAKSPMLKSKSVQYLVSFMNEPNTVANMAEKAVRDATKGDWKGGLRTAHAVIGSIIFTNVLKSIIIAMRDDDEDETYTEKYIESIVGGMMSDFNPLIYIPLVRDAWSLTQGHNVEREDMAIVADAIYALGSVVKNAFTDTDDMTEEQLIAFDKKATDANWNLVGSLASFFGIPVKNIRREIEGVINTVTTTAANAGKTTSGSAWDKVQDAVIDSIPFMSTESKQDKLYDAIVNGDTEYVNRLKSGYVDKAGKFDQSKYDTAVRKALRENDPRIHQAAQAGYNGNSEERNRIFQEIKKEGKFRPSEIIDAINSELSAIRKKSEPDKVTGQYNTDDFVDAVAMGDTQAAQSIKDDIVDTYMANGKSTEEAEKSFASSAKSEMRKLYVVGALTEKDASEALKAYCPNEDGPLDDNDVYWIVREWNYEKTNGSSEGYGKYNDFHSAVETGNNLKTVIKEYTDHGVDDKTLASQITKHFKPLYKEMSNTERAAIKRYLLNAYALLGYDRAKKSKDINEWLHD